MKPRPALRYHGGKWLLAPWIISHFPAHRTYTEVFGGGASVLIRKPRSYAEIYNDLDGEVVNVFQMFRDRGEELLEKLWATPFARDEFVQSYYPSDDCLETARRTIVRSFMGFGSSSVTMTRNIGSKGGKPATGFRANSNRSGTTPAHDWSNYVGCAQLLIERFRGVTIENKDASKILLQYDNDGCLHYVDPPYVSSSRDKGNDYRHEMTDEQHQQLSEILHSLCGRVIISGYRSDLYDQLYNGWRQIECKAFADGASPRTEVLWMNFKTEGLF